MNITDTPDTDSIPAAQSVNRLFAHIAPAAAETVAPFVERLFAALSHGNTFIYISQAEADALAQAAPLVGSDASSPIVLASGKTACRRNPTPVRAHAKAA